MHIIMMLVKCCSKTLQCNTGVLQRGTHLSNPCRWRGRRLVGGSFSWNALIGAYSSWSAGEALRVYGMPNGCTLASVLKACVAEGDGLCGGEIGRASCRERVFGRV